jgi:hypothetical protein
VAALSLVVAIASFAIPAVNGYDPWAWLVWGREIPLGRLDTTGGPSWKPLPVVATVVLSPLGSLAPGAWLLVTRALGVMAIAFTYRIGARYAGRVAGLVAVALLVLGPDADPRFVRLLLEGHTGIATATLTLWAFERHLDGRRAEALLIGTALGLLRPEAWPFLGLYAVWLWRTELRIRPLVVGCLASIPLLWFVPDWIGSGSPWNGADVAQVAFRDTTNRIELAFRRAGELVVLPAWIAAAAGVVSAARRGERALLVAAMAAIAWTALVIAMTAAFHYAALSRFFMPAVAIVCILAGIGVARVVASVPAGLRVLVASGLVVLLVPFLLPRLSGIPDVLNVAHEQAMVEDDFRDVFDGVGGTAWVLGCGAVTVDPRGGMRPVLAWLMEVPMSSVGYGPLDEPGVVFARPGSPLDTELTELDDPEIVTVARNERWSVYAVECSPES